MPNDCPKQIRPPVTAGSKNRRESQPSWPVGNRLPDSDLAICLTVCAQARYKLGGSRGLHPSSSCALAPTEINRRTHVLGGRHFPSVCVLFVCIHEQMNSGRVVIKCSQLLSFFIFFKQKRVRAEVEFQSLQSRFKNLGFSSPNMPELSLGLSRPHLSQEKSTSKKTNKSKFTHS